MEVTIYIIDKYLITSIICCRLRKSLFTKETACTRGLRGAKDKLVEMEGYPDPVRETANIDEIDQLIHIYIRERKREMDSETLRVLFNY